MSEQDTSQRSDATATRINVIGTSGSGKSTFARALAERLALPYVEMDALFWKPDWQESSDDEFFARVADVVAGDQWVLDGNYSRTTPLKWARAQRVIWLDLPFLQTVWRVTERAFERSLSQREMWPGTGNRETLAKAFLSKDSIIRWSIQSHGRNRRRYPKAMADPHWAAIDFIRLRGSNAISAYLDACSPAPLLSSPDG